MKIFIAGATGVVGKQLIPLLIQYGHQVAGTTRTQNKVNQLREMGAEPVVMDALDRDSVLRAVVGARPDVVVHQLTDLGKMANLKHFDEEFGNTNRLRTEATGCLLAAARTAGARKFVAQSYAGWSTARGGAPVKTEEDPLDPNPPRTMSKTLAAIRSLEDAVSSAPDLGGVVLRYGSFYGPGTNLAPGGTFFEAIRKRQVPVVGDGAGIWSFLHVHDAASATLLAIESTATGIYNIVDDDPSPVAVWLPEIARVIGAPPPRHLPAWIARLFIGEAGVTMMTETRGASNAKAKRVLNWRPDYGSWRKGFAEIIASQTSPNASREYRSVMTRG